MDLLDRRANAFGKRSLDVIVNCEGRGTALWETGTSFSALLLIAGLAGVAGYSSVSWVFANGYTYVGLIAATLAVVAWLALRRGSNVPPMSKSRA